MGHAYKLRSALYSHCNSLNILQLFNSKLQSDGLSSRLDPVTAACRIRNSLSATSPNSDLARCHSGGLHSFSIALIHRQPCALVARSCTWLDVPVFLTRKMHDC